MAYVTAEARQELLADVAAAIDELDVALGALGTAYEQLDEPTADVLEAELFRPVQVAYGRAQRTHAGFAERYGLAGRAFVPGVPSASPHSVRELLDTAVGAVIEADAVLVRLQDSMRPVEVGDAELRAGLAEVRELISAPPERARRFLSLLGR
jgi:hypothetical protein